MAERDFTALELSLIDATGRVVWREWSEQQNTLRLDCTALPDGIYFVRFHTGAETGVRKLIIGR